MSHEPAPLVPSFFSIDLILTPKGEVKIVELNRGVDSGFFGYKALHNVDLFEKAVAQMPFRHKLYADRPDNLVGRMAGLLPDIELQDNLPAQPYIYPGAMDMYGHLRQQHPDAVIVDGSLPLYAAFKNKAMFHALFAPHCPDMLPQTQIVPYGHDWEWLDFAKHNFSGKVLVLKTPEDIQGDGVFILKADGDADIFDAARLYTSCIDDVTRADMREFLDYPSFVVQELVPSAPVKFEGEDYTCCVRVAVLALPVNGRLQVEYLGAYAKPVPAPMNARDVKSLSDLYVSDVKGADGYNRPRAAAVGKAAFERITTALAKGFEPALEKVMAMRPAGMAMQLLASDDEGTRMTALNLLFERDMFSAHGMDAKEIKALQTAYAGYLDESTAAQRYTLMKLASSARADIVPDIFRGVTERAVRKNFCISMKGAFPHNVFVHETHPIESLGAAFRFASRLNDKPRDDMRSHLTFRQAPYEREVLAFAPRPFTKKGDLVCSVEGCMGEETDKKPEKREFGADEIMAVIAMMGRGGPKI